MFLISIYFALLFIFVQQVEAKEEEDREAKYIKQLLEYRTFRFLHKYKVILFSSSYFFFIIIFLFMNDIIVLY